MSKKRGRTRGGPGRERRYLPVRELRVVRADEGDEAPKIRGHAAVFEQLSDDLGGFREKIRAGAFADTIERDDIRALWNHNSDYVLGRNRAGTLELEEDDEGLAVEITPPDTQWARDAMVSIERGDVSQMSFGFITRKDEWETVDGGPDIRTLVEVELFDVSPVTFPAYPDTDVAVRSHEEWQEKRSAEQRAEGADLEVYEALHRRRGRDLGLARASASE